MPVTTVPEAARSGAALPRGLMVLLGLAAAVVVIGGMKAASGLIAPTFLALVMTILAHPLRGWLDRWMPSWVASLICIAAVYVGVVLFASALVVSIARFATLLPEYTTELSGRIDDATAMLNDFGVSTEQIQTVASSFDIGQLGGFLTGLLSQILDLVSNLFFILTLVLFMTMDASNFPAKLAQVRASRPGIVEAFGLFAKGTRRYLAVSTVFGLIVAVLDTAALALLDIPAPLLWGLLAFITNYIPNIGFIIGLVPPAILGLLEGGPSLMLAVIAVYCVLNVVIQTVIQPKVVGDEVGLNTTITFVSLIFWTWVIGPLGAVLAIPLTLFAKAVMVDVDPSTRWMRPLISNQSEPTEETS